MEKSGSAAQAQAHGMDVDVDGVERKGKGRKQKQASSLVAGLVASPEACKRSPSDSQAKPADKSAAWPCALEGEGERVSRPSPLPRGPHSIHTYILHRYSRRKERRRKKRNAERVSLGSCRRRRTGYSGWRPVLANSHPYREMPMPSPRPPAGDPPVREQV